jgi:hypothetical protein
MPCITDGSRTLFPPVQLAAPSGDRHSHVAKPITKESPNVTKLLQTRPKQRLRMSAEFLENFVYSFGGVLWGGISFFGA